MKQDIKATVYINRHVIAANKKQTKETGKIVDNPAITINTTDGSILVNKVKFTECTLLQDALLARCSGATIWLETTLDKIEVAGKSLTREYFQQIKQEQELNPTSGV